ncbi:neutral ceramidase 2-like protein [Tanacetum coccineum]
MRFNDDTPRVTLLSLPSYVHHVDQDGSLDRNYRHAKVVFILNMNELLDTSINRCPSGYLNNPEEDRRKYDTDKEMTLLKFVDDTWGPVGSFNWFATHGTSMSPTNSLITGDNKGAAALIMEDWYNSNVTHKGFEIIQSVTDSGASHYRVPQRICNIIPNYHEHRRRPQFVSAFCQSNCGGVSPIVLGAFCINTDLPCDFNQSTCNGRNELCYDHGPGYPDEFESTRIIGERQFKKAAELFESASVQLKGKVGYGHSYTDFCDLSVRLSNVNESVRTCPAAKAFAFAVGTTDGPGAFLNPSLWFILGFTSEVVEMKICMHALHWKAVTNISPNKVK